MVPSPGEAESNINGVAVLEPVKYRNCRMQWAAQLQGNALIETP